MFLIRLGFCFVLLCFTNLTTAAYFFHFLAHIFPPAAVTHVYSEVLFLWGTPSPWGHTSEEQVLDWGWREGEPYLPAVSISWAQQRLGEGGSEEPGKLLLLFHPISGPQIKQENPRHCAVTCYCVAITQWPWAADLQQVYSFHGVALRTPQPMSVEVYSFPGVTVDSQNTTEHECGGVQLPWGNCSLSTLCSNTTKIAKGQLKVSFTSSIICKSKFVFQ